MSEHPDPVQDALANLGRAIAEVDRALEAHAALNDRAAWLKALDWSRGIEDKGLYQQLAVVVASLKARLAAQMPYGEDVTVPGVGTLTYANSGGSTKWNWPRLVPVLAAQIADEVFDRETGEIPPLAVVCERAINAFGEIVSLTPSKKGKTTALEARGLDPKQFVTTTDAEPSVRFTA